MSPHSAARGSDRFVGEECVDDSRECAAFGEAPWDSSNLNSSATASYPPGFIFGANCDENGDTAVMSCITSTN